MPSPVDLVWYATIGTIAVVWVVSWRTRSTGSAPKADVTPRAVAPTPAARGRLSEALDPRSNGLNLLRLVLATAVIVWHSLPLTGRSLADGPLRQGLSMLPVDGFFAISGFLIAGSWVRRPDFLTFMRSRVLRIFPGFLACLAVTALVIAPLANLVAHAYPIDGYWRSSIGYVLHNVTLNMTQYDIAGTPSGVAYPAVWNGSLWTLKWEFLCYAGIAVVGLLGGLRRRAPSIVLFVSALLVTIVVDVTSWSSFGIENWSRFGMMFLAGVVVYVCRDLLPVSPTLTIASGLVVLGSLWLDNYRTVGALFLAYFLITLASFVRHRHLQLRNDVSYGVYIYAFPVQQLLASTGLGEGSFVGFVATAVLITVPVAMASWFLVEKPALARVRRRPRISTPDVDEPAPEVSRPR